MNKRYLLKWLSGVAATLVLGTGVGSERALAQSKPGVLRVAMTAGDIPLTTGAPSQGGEGIRFMGITVYDGLTRWDLSKSDRLRRVIPDLAESWTINPDDKKVWTSGSAAA